ncbi:pilin [Paludibacterium yongneupense]|uniref:pilin n=1 Tax=Paludibacterium yongneupense TaxID=400061 RepID=UPI00048B354A|nr:pilin [Paludibacterium yongneupense]
MRNGYTLIELMVVVAIVAILTTLAIPQYQDYAVRAKLGEGLQALAVGRNALAEHVLAEGAFPPDGYDGMDSAATDYMAGLEYHRVGSGGVLSVRVRNTGSEADDKYFSLVGEVLAGAIVWRCRPGDAVGGDSRAVPARYLPGPCRRGEKGGIPGENG